MIRRLGKSNAGIAMPMAIGIIAIIGIVGLCAVFFVESQTSLGVRYRDQETAFHYADAGINDYIWHMNQDPYYYTNPNQQISQDMDFENGQYKGHYVVSKYDDGNTPNPYPSDPTQKQTLTIHSTGWIKSDPNNRTTIEVKLSLRSFSEYLIFTNYEGTQEHPTSKDDTLNNPTANAVRSNWILWKTGETANGPIHTNDTFHLMAKTPYTGPTFNGEVTYSNQMSKDDYDKNKVVPPNLYCLAHNSYNDSHVQPTYNGGNPYWIPKIDLPPGNDSLKALALKDGLYLKGRTCIGLHGNEIWYRNKGGSLVKVPLPRNGVIYVDQDGSGGTGKWDLKRGNVFISGNLSGRLTVAAANDIYITGKDPTNYSNPSSYKDSNGGIFYNDPNDRDMLGLVANEDIKILHTGWPLATGGQHDIHEGAKKNDCWFVAPKNLYINAVLFAISGSFGLENDYLNEPPPNQTTLQEQLGTVNINGSLIENTENYVGHLHLSAIKKTRWVYTNKYGWHQTYITYGNYNPEKGKFPDPYYYQFTGYTTKHYNFDGRLLNVSPPHIMDPEQGGWVVVSWKKIAPDYNVQP